MSKQYDKGFVPFSSSYSYLAEAADAQYSTKTVRMVKVQCLCGTINILSCSEWSTAKIKSCKPCSDRRGAQTRKRKHIVGEVLDGSRWVYMGEAENRVPRHVNVECLCGTAAVVSYSSWHGKSSTGCVNCRTSAASAAKIIPYEDNFTPNGSFLSFARRLPCTSRIVTNCVCGAVFEVDHDSWKSLNTKSCGCSRETNCFSNNRISILYLVVATTYQVYGKTNVEGVAQARLHRPLSYGLPICALYEGAGLNVSSAEAEIKARLVHYEGALGDGRLTESLIHGQEHLVHEIATRHNLVAVLR